MKTAHCTRCKDVCDSGDLDTNGVCELCRRQHGRGQLVEQASADRSNGPLSHNTQNIAISTTPQVVKALEALAASGFYGRTVEEVAEQFLRERVRDLAARGQLKGWKSVETGR